MSRKRFRYASLKTKKKRIYRWRQNLLCIIKSVRTKKILHRLYCYCLFTETVQSIHFCSGQYKNSTRLLVFALSVNSILVIRFSHRIFVLFIFFFAKLRQSTHLALTYSAAVYFLKWWLLFALVIRIVRNATDTNMLLWIKL